MYEEIATSLMLLVALTGCKVKFSDTSHVKDACQFLDYQGVEEKVCTEKIKSASSTM